LKTFIDLFSGIGGFRLAFENHKAKCIFSIDNDKDACETYKFNFDEYQIRPVV
jgi:DNA (cytosine-5)-methyltransferase 1